MEKQEALTAAIAEAFDQQVDFFQRLVRTIPRVAQRDKLKQSEKKQPANDAVWSKSRGTRQRLRHIET